MATTEKGIYYPNDGTQPADVLGDMKKMAESIDEAINDNTYDDTEIKEDISKIKEEQEKQNKNIEKNVTNITALQEENANLKAQIPQGQAEGEEISLSDSAKMELVEFGLQGNSRQETTQGLQILKNTNEGAAGWNSSVGNGALNLTSIIEDGIDCAKFAVTEAITSYCVLYRNANLSKLKNNTTYTIQLDVKANKTGFLYSAIQTTAANNQLINFVGKNYTTAGQWQTLKMIATSNSVAISDQVLYFGFNNLTDIDDYIELRNVVLAEGDYSNTDLEWEKYTGVEASPNLNYPSMVQAVGDSGSVEIIKSNKNLLDLNYRNANGITFDKNRITVVNPTSYNNGIDSKLIKNKLLCGKNISVKIISNGSVVSGYVPSLVISTNKNAYRFQKVYYVNDYNNEVTNITRQFSEDEYISGIQFYTNYSQGGTKCNLAIDVQVEIADEATDFVEHQGNTCTLPIQKTMLNGDYIDLENKKEVHTYTKKVVSNTSEFNVNKNNNDKTFQFTVGITNPIQNAKVICNMFKFSPNTWNNTGCQISGNLFYGIVKFGDFGFTEDLTIEQAKQKFGEIIAETNLVFYYKTTTPEELDLTEEQAQVLEQIIEDGTYKGVTHFYTEEDLKPTIEVKYYKDLETLFKNQEQMQATLDNVQAQLLDLGGNLDE